MTDSPGGAGPGNGPAKQGAVILVYHRVTRLVSDPFRIAVNPERFADHLDLISGDFRPLSLKSLVKGLGSGRLPARGVCLTLDDGYADNLRCAAPALEAAGIPATVFVATETLEGGEFWWDRLEQLFLGPGHLPARIRMRLGRRLLDERLEAAPDSEGAAPHAGWSIRDEAPPTGRHRAFVSAFEAMQRMTGALRAEAISELYDRVGREPETRPTHVPMRAADVSALAAMDHVTIGAHTVSHPRLSKLRRPARRREIRDSRDRLASIVGYPIRHFAYPFGDSGHSVELARREGMEAALTTRPDIVRARCDPCALPRIYVGDWPVERLARRLEEVFAGSNGGPP